MRIAAQRATPEDIARLEQRQHEHRESMLALDRFLERDMLFHREIAIITGLILGIACATFIVPAIVEITRNLTYRRVRDQVSGSN